MGVQPLDDSVPAGFMVRGAQSYRCPRPGLTVDQHPGAIGGRWPQSLRQTWLASPVIARATICPSAVPNALMPNRHRGCLAR